MQSFISKYKSEILVFALYLVLAVLLNLQLLQGSNVHSLISGHDEYLTVRQVYNILEPASLKHFVMAVISGEKLYYGRVMFYTDAAVAWLPYQLFGLSGMVFSIRMLHALLIIFSLFILGRTFISNPFYRTVFYILCILGFNSFYFIMLPKPEPYQLFFISMFLRSWKNNNYSTGRHFIWLGLAYGAKFNALFLVPVFLVMGTWNQWKEAISGQVRTFIGPFGKSVLWWLCGFLIAIPCLILSPVKPQFFTTYLEHTFLFGAQPDDDPSVTWMTWLKEGYGYYYWGHNALTWLFLTLVLLLAFRVLYLNIKRNKTRHELVLLITAALFFFPIVFFTKRVWPHYLWEGHLFFVLFFFASLQSLYIKSRIPAIAGYVLMLLPLIYFSTNFVLQHAAKYFDLNLKYGYKMENWRHVRDYIVSQKSNAVVAQDLSLWYPFEEFVKVNRYHPFRVSLPRDTSSPIFTWELPTDPGTAPEELDYLVAGEILKVSANKKYAPGIEKDKERWQAAFKNAEGKVWKKDTAFLDVVIFKRIREGRN